MTIQDINDIIKAVCPNDEDYEKPCISPKYLRQELEQLALEQEEKMLNTSTRYIILQVQENSFTVCHGIFNDFYKTVGKCVCLIGDSDDSWIENDYKITDRKDMWRTETENGFGWYRKYVHENLGIVVEETWLVIEGEVEE